ncbi:hypothetical protein MFIFM68171_00676 [Madurella fahalii]|uniref:Uncharacterized protein n=1 Tax=Madurella fahalii TaxID=1157608 RepID=A0ABQ0FY84_9PEZI
MGKKKKIPAIVHQFDAYFGSGTLEDWQRLCRDIGLDGDFSSIKKCRKALRRVYINIHDLVAAAEQGTQPQRFPNHKALVKCTL